MIRFGLVGAGQIAHACAGQINGHPDAEVIAVSDPHEKRCSELASELGISRSYTDSEKLFADGDVDAVYIAVPNKFHAPLAIRALEAGKHVILDKPFALSADEAGQVLASAEKSGKLFTLGMNQRFVPDCQKIKSLVKRGDLGEIYHAKAYWFRRTGIPKLGTWFGKKEISGGGCILDIGVHLLDLCLYTMGNFRPVSVSGATYGKFGHRGLGEGGWGLSDREEIPFDVEDFASALIKFENGSTVTLDVSWACHQRDANRMNVELYGTEAGAGLYPAELFRYGSGPGEYQLVQNPDASLAYPEGNRFTNFINAILGREDLCAAPEQIMAVQRILDGIYESCASGREIRLQ